MLQNNDQAVKSKETGLEDKLLKYSILIIKCVLF